MLNILVATMVEARPLIDFYRLQKCTDAHAFTLYEADALRLVIAGIGKVPAAAATAYLLGLQEDAGASAWLNIGIAGHGSRAVGDVFLAHKIQDNATSQVWYPPLVIPFELPSSCLLTLDEPSTDYQDDLGFDMEASGFYPIALRNSTAELVHCLKIVSDNAEMPLDINDATLKDRVVELVQHNMSQIDATAQRLLGAVLEYRRIYDAPPLKKSLTEQLHFTQTQLSQLTRLLQRGYTLLGQDFEQSLNFSAYQQAKPLLADIESLLEKQKVEY